MSVSIRLATAEHLGAVRDIFNHYVATSTCTFQVDEAGGVVGWAALSP